MFVVALYKSPLCAVVGSQNFQLGFAAAEPTDYSAQFACPIPSFLELWIVDLFCCSFHGQSLPAQSIRQTERLFVFYVTMGH